MARVELDAVTKAFGAHVVIHAVDVHIDDGEFVVFVGPSGCGKSTLLRLIAGLEQANAGHIIVDGKVCNDVEPQDRGLAMVFQSYALYPHKTVFQNMAFALQLARVPKPDIAERVRKAAAVLQMEDLLGRRPHELSGGQRQRVAIGRAIVRDPKVFLFDEPLSNLDASLRSQMRVELSALHRRLNATMIYVTHDQIEAMTMADKIIVLNQGRVEQAGRPIDIYNRPASRFVAGFIGSPKMNFFEGDAAARFGAHAVGVRPEHLDLSLTAGRWTGEIGFVEHLGSDTYIHVQVPDLGTMVARLQGEQQLEAGNTVFLDADPDRLHLFDADGRTIDRDRSVH